MSILGAMPHLVDLLELGAISGTRVGWESENGGEKEIGEKRGSAMCCKTTHWPYITKIDQVG